MATWIRASVAGALHGAMEAMEIAPERERKHAEKILSADDARVRKTGCKWHNSPHSTHSPPDTPSTPPPPRSFCWVAPGRGALATHPLPYPTLPPPPLGPRRHALPAPRAASILHHEKAMKSATDTVGGNFKFLMPLDETERAVSVSESRYQ